MKKFALSVALLFCAVAFAEIGHTTLGTDYGQEGVAAYVVSNHGPDGMLFLDPYFTKEIEYANHKKILDAGCGAAPWAIYAAKHGGEVYAIDIQDGMVQAAKKAVQVAGLCESVFIVQGDVASLPYSSHFFDTEMSICVSCNLPIESCEKHFIECFRTLKDDGTVIIGAPTSLDVVFSNGSKSKSEILVHIQEVLEALPDNPTPELISERLNKLEEVLRATFYIKENRLTLVVNENQLQEGEPMWRKLPTLVVPNCYYSQDFYINVLKKCNFAIQKIDLPRFETEEERVAYNQRAPINSKLGKEYVLHAPFVIFHLKK